MSMSGRENDVWGVRYCKRMDLVALGLGPIITSFQVCSSMLGCKITICLTLVRYSGLSVAMKYCRPDTSPQTKT
jgi:hypothetical protein